MVRDESSRVLGIGCLCADAAVDLKRKLRLLVRLVGRLLVDRRVTVASTLGVSERR